MSEIGENGIVGAQTRNLQDFDHEAKSTPDFLKSLPPTPEEKPRSLMQRLGRIGIVAAALTAVGISYKAGLMNTVESEQKGLPNSDHSQTINHDPSSKSTH